MEHIGTVTTELSTWQYQGRVRGWDMRKDALKAGLALNLDFERG